MYLYIYLSIYLSISISISILYLVRLVESNSCSPRISSQRASTSVEESIGTPADTRDDAGGRAASQEAISGGMAPPAPEIEMGAGPPAVAENRGGGVLTFTRYWYYQYCMVHSIHTGG